MQTLNPSKDVFDTNKTVSCHLRYFPFLVVRGFGTDGGKSSSEMDYPGFFNALNKSGFNLSEPETKQIFNAFRLTGPNGMFAGYMPPFCKICRGSGARIFGHMICIICSSEFSGQAYARNIDDV